MKPTVILFSESQALAINVLENLLANFCRVKVFTREIKNWKEKTCHLGKNNNLEFINKKSFSGAGEAEYLIYLDLYPEDLRKLAEKVKQIAETAGAKGFLITSQQTFPEGEKLLDKNGRLGIVYLTNLYGARMEFDVRNRTSELIGAALSGKRAKVYKAEKIYPIPLTQTAGLISKWLFSFGPIGEETRLSSKGLEAGDFCRLIKNYKPAFSYAVSEKTAKTPINKDIRTVVVEDNCANCLREVFDYYRSSPAFPKRKIKIKKNVFYVFSGIVLVAASPLLMILPALGLLYFAKNLILKGNLPLSRQAVVVSRVFASASDRGASLFGRIPLAGRPYRDLASFAYATGNIGRVSQKAIDVLHNAKTLTGMVFGQNGYSVSAYSEEISADLDYIEKTIAFGEGEIKHLPGILKKIDIGQAKLLVRELKQLTSVLPELLGEHGKKTYLVLFQNNMELRPGGGFIGSFALVSFEAGRLIDMTVSDIYSADGQLKGHVEPPVPLKQYLNQANWFLRDSNWDVDFAKNAQKAEWFLDKEIDVAVSGVVAFDLRVAKDLLKVIGPVFLSDYRIKITPENLYEKTQTEVEEDFFPGSAQKAGFLTALARTILDEVVQGPISDFPRLGRTLYQNLTERHVQLFLHNPVAGGALANLGWNGAFLPGQIGTVEANLGVNKANYFIRRQSFLTVSGDSWHLRIIYENKANSALGSRGVYKNYLRLVTPLTAVNIKGNPYILDVTETTGRKESGLYFEVLPGEKQEINIYWQQPGGKVISWRKQPGIEGDPATLTVDGEVVYNSTFDRDIVWINTF